MSEKSKEIGDKKNQVSLTFKKILNFPTPKRYEEKFKIIDEIDKCLNENLIDTSTSNKIKVLKYILNIYVLKRKSILKLGIDEIESSDCCEQIIKWVDNKIDELKKLPKFGEYGYGFDPLSEPKKQSYTTGYDNDEDFERAVKKTKKDEVDQIINSESEQIETKPEQRNLNSLKSENDFTVSTIEDYLHPFEKSINPQSYKYLVEYLKQYFDNGEFPLEMKEIKVSKVNLKAFGYALSRIYNALKNENEKISYKYLLFGKQYISIFKNVPLTEMNMNKCRLYKYYTTKTSMKSH